MISLMNNYINVLSVIIVTMESRAFVIDDNLGNPLPLPSRSLLESYLCYSFSDAQECRSSIFSLLSMLLLSPPGFKLSSEPTPSILVFSHRELLTMTSHELSHHQP